MRPQQSNSGLPEMVGLRLLSVNAEELFREKEHESKKFVFFSF